ncbi:hypothetical protein Acr_28g0000400 [Actinidia rufa]|uniref:Reverse transcriptase domain-containing protein n=1 Tax=Actinidia rufa TaxID=165716 RepID=A0A7J0H8P9_9ERIC|nr:hypothetical protein Acr_28g0000400 [Actinidia rufa]
MMVLHLLIGMLMIPRFAFASLDDMSIENFYDKFYGIYEEIDLSEPITDDVVAMKQQRESMLVARFLSILLSSFLRSFEPRSSPLSARYLVIFARPPSLLLHRPLLSALPWLPLWALSPLGKGVGHGRSDYFRVSCRFGHGSRDSSGRGRGHDDLYLHKGLLVSPDCTILSCYCYSSLDRHGDKQYDGSGQNAGSGNNLVWVVKSRRSSGFEDSNRSEAVNKDGIAYATASGINVDKEDVHGVDLDKVVPPQIMGMVSVPPAAETPNILGLTSLSPAADQAEGFFAILQQKIGQGSCSYHPECRALGLSHLAFADDLFVLCGADSQSLFVIKEALDDFFYFSGLKPNLRKSAIFFSGVNSAVQEELNAILPMPEGHLPI